MAAFAVVEAVLEEAFVVVEAVLEEAFVEALVVVVEPYLPWLSSLGKAGDSFKESGLQYLFGETMQDM